MPASPSSRSLQRKRGHPAASGRGGLPVQYHTLASDGSRGDEASPDAYGPPAAARGAPPRGRAGGGLGPPPPPPSSLLSRQAGDTPQCRSGVRNPLAPLELEAG